MWARGLNLGPCTHPASWRILLTFTNEWERKGARQAMYSLRCGGPGNGTWGLWSFRLDGLTSVQLSWPCAKFFICDQGSDSRSLLIQTDGKAAVSPATRVPHVTEPGLQTWEYKRPTQWGILQIPLCKFNIFICFIWNRDRKKLGGKGEIGRY